MRLEAGKLREKLLSSVTKEKTTAVEMARAEMVSAVRRERELEEMIRSNAEKVFEASRKARTIKRGEEEKKRTREEGLVVVDD